MLNDTGHDYGHVYQENSIELWNENEMRWNEYIKGITSEDTRVRLEVLSGHLYLPTSGNSLKQHRKAAMISQGGDLRPVTANIMCKLDQRYKELISSIHYRIIIIIIINFISNALNPHEDIPMW